MTPQPTSITVKEDLTVKHDKPQPTSITVKEELTIKHDKPQPTNLGQKDKSIKQLCQTHSIS